MLLKLMVFLGNDRSDSIAKIEAKTDSSNTEVSVLISESGYAELVFPYDKKQSWSYLGWALDELGVDVEDRDPVEGSYFIKVNPKKGLFAKLLGSVDNKNTFQLVVREVGVSQTSVIFSDLSEENEDDTMNYSAELFNNIASKF